MLHACAAPTVAIVRVNDFEAWLQGDLQLMHAGLDNPGPWRVCAVLVTRQAAESVELVLPNTASVLTVGGCPLRCHLLEADGPDVWVELAPVDAAPRSSRVVVYRHLTLGLETTHAAAYGRIRDDGYSPADARLLTAALWA